MVCMYLGSCLQMLSASCRMTLGKFYCWGDLHVRRKCQAEVLLHWCVKGMEQYQFCLNCCISWANLLCQTPLSQAYLTTALHLLDRIEELVSLLGPFSDCSRVNNWEPVPSNPAQLRPTVLPLLVQILSNYILVSQPYSPCEWFEISADLELVLSGWRDHLLLAVCACCEKVMYVSTSSKALLPREAKVCLLESHRQVGCVLPFPTCDCSL